jgi:hypothetical protein
MFYKPFECINLPFSINSVVNLAEVFVKLVIIENFCKRASEE